MDIYELLKEENQQFWDCLNLNNPDVSASVIAMEQDDEMEIIEEIEII